MSEHWLRLTYHRPPLSLNGRQHYQVVARTKKSLSGEAMVRAMRARLPRGCTYADITLVYNPPDVRPRDEDNLVATLKPLVDGLVKYGLVADDDSTHVHTECRIGPVRRPGEIWLRIEASDGGA